MLDLVLNGQSKEERERELRVKLADSYLNRIRGFQNQLLIWMVSLNFVVFVYIAAGFEAIVETHEVVLVKSFSPILVAVLALILNCVAASIYSNEKKNSRLLLDQFTELDFFPAPSRIQRDSVRGKTWNNYRVIKTLFVITQFVLIASVVFMVKLF